MNRFVMVLVLGVLLLTSACRPTQQSAAFKQYEREGTGQYTDSELRDLLGAPQVEKTKATGNALVTLSDGTDVTALCPIQGLEPGTGVLVQQNDDGTWVVTAKQ